MKTRARFAPSIRVKALLLLPLVLAIPYVGYQYVREMENFLRAGLEDALVATARALAGGLHDQPGLFEQSVSSGQDANRIYAHPLPAPIEIDGYVSDWGYHLSGLQTLPSMGEDRGARYVVGKHAGYLYLLFQVEDDEVVYRDPQPVLPKHSDAVRVVLVSPEKQQRAFVLSPPSPGRVSAYQIPKRNDSSSPIKIEIRILAAWQSNASGYSLELRLPLSMIGGKIGF